MSANRQPIPFTPIIPDAEPRTAGNVPPQDLAAEQAVLGAILLRNELRARLTIKADHFYRTPHQILYRAMSWMLNRGQPVDVVTLAAHLRAHGVLENVGGPAYLAGLSVAVPVTAHVAHYAALVIEKGQRRILLHALSEALVALHDEQVPLSDTVDAITDALDLASDRKDVP